MSVDTKALRDLLSKATPGEWLPGHLADDAHTCNCPHIVGAHGPCGAIATVSFDNGLPISGGGNDAPPLEQAKANLALIAAAKNSMEALLDAAEENARLRRALRDLGSLFARAAELHPSRSLREVIPDPAFIAADIKRFIEEPRNA